jgi:O-antigen/teichoic acid export membrane protein
MGVATLVVVAAPWLVTLLYGEDFSLAAELLPWFFVAAVPWAITSILLSRARLEERGWAVLAITGTLAVTTLVPAIVLIPRIGVDGAAVAWVAGNLAAAVVAVATSGGGVGGAIVRRLPIRRRARSV